MSHELRTPLNAIIGFSETMLRFPAMYDDVKLPPAYEDDLQQIYTSGRQLLMLINDILDLAKVDAGKLDVRIDRVDLNPLLKKVVSTAGGLIGGKPVRLETDIPDDLPLIWADSARVEQVLLNLYSNAAKFTDRGAIRLTVSPAEGGVRISLSDTGIGISQDNLDVIFEEFKQAETGGRDPRSGAGLGLAISRQLMALMGGRIWAESELGKGSTFHFVLPAYEEAATAPAQAALANARA
jgi:signal transduction histidine kinase